MSIPAGGLWSNTTYDQASLYGYYWCTTLDTTLAPKLYASFIYFASSGDGLNNSPSIYTGYLVRPVR